MGYRSDVRIITTGEGWNKLKTFTEEYVKSRSCIETNIFKEAFLDYFRTTEDGEIVYLGWNCIKWYEHCDYFDVDGIMKGLIQLKELDIPYRYARIGEDYGDYDEYYHTNQNDILPNTSLIREFDDQWVVDEMQAIYDMSMKENKKRKLHYNLRDESSPE